MGTVPDCNADVNHLSDIDQDMISTYCSLRNDGSGKTTAFNSYLEASNAREYGECFGDVAAEIRRLAESATNLTREIRTKIQEIQKAAK
jgi:hypothetical protein